MMPAAFHGIRYRHWLNLAILAPLVVVFGIAVKIILQTPCVGIADIFDFWRVMRPAGIEHVGDLEHPGYYVQCTFRTTRAELLSAPSSSAILAWSAKHLTWGLSPGDGLFDIRQMGLLYMAILASTLAMGIARGFPILIALFITYVIVDPGYLLFFNSFYADSALFIALIGTSICLERLETPSHSTCGRGVPAWALTAVPLVVFAFLGGCSKMQYVFFPAVILVATSIPLITRARECPSRVVALAAALAIVLGVCCWNFFLGPGPRFLKFNNYHAVYGGILRVASNPDEVLEDLDVPRQHWDLPRTDAWSGKIDAEHPVHRHLKDLSRFTLLKWYLLDSSARSSILDEIATKLVLVESHPRGNHVREESDRNPVKRTFQVPWQFSRLSRWLLAAWPPIVWLVFVGCAAWILLAKILDCWTGMTTTTVFLLLWSASQVVVAILGEGLINLHQHLIGARLGLDLLFVFVLADVGSAVCSQMSSRRHGHFKMPGPNHR